ncbi:MAG: L-ribulose-5-phosphate 4-epimerase AraD [Planctomycetota bacterium]|jgi:L-ribulose-5-phosphate 4-epimerase|nr:L-ribulose-5-phosphate 4-epimerase AraD [Planctomycetota bacterium]
MNLEQLKQEVYEANLLLVRYNLVISTWGNVSGIDRQEGRVVIKPSGVPYQTLTPEQMVVVNLDGSVVSGKLKPSSDTPTHLELYRAWPDIGGVCHTHSSYATIFAQAGVAVPCLGTTHADFAPGDIPCVPALSKEEVEAAYEENTGKAIIREFAQRKPLEFPGALLQWHGPFTWGRTAQAAADNAQVLEQLAFMALETRLVNPAVDRLPSHIRDKHYFRKHGPQAYYGQG